MSKLKAGHMTVAVALGCVFFACLFVAFQRPALFEVLNAMVVAVGVGVTISFTIPALRVLRAPPEDLTAGRVLVLGIWLLWIGIVLAFYSLWRFRLDGDHWWLNVGWTAATRWLIFCGGALHLAAAGAIDQRIPKRAYIRAGVIAAFGVAFGLFLISFGIE